MDLIRESKDYDKFVPLGGVSSMLAAGFILVSNR